MHGAEGTADEAEKAPSCFLEQEGAGGSPGGPPGPRPRAPLSASGLSDSARDNQPLLRLKQNYKGAEGKGQSSRGYQSI